MARYECTTGGHNKFWESEVISVPKGPRRGAMVQSTWGPIGDLKVVHRKVKHFDTLSQAVSYQEAKITEKIRKGYVLSGGVEVNRRKTAARVPRRKAKRVAKATVQAPKAKVVPLSDYDILLMDHVEGLV